ncbi:calcium-binding protein, partial [Rhizobium viscosum]|uniref:calcium-binding protein n=1 Tax=Rhizobium viscosum TaxID=1673 RepID=UPI00362CD4B3
MSGIEIVVGSGYGDILGASGANGTVILRGGAGDDVYEVRGPNVVVEEQLNSGNDTVKVSGVASYTLSGNVENLTHEGSTSFTGTGNDLDNIVTGGLGNDVLHGGNGNDILIGGAGADVLNGGAGTDTVSYAGSSSGVTIDLDAGTGHGGDAEGDTLSGIEVVVGSGYGDTLIA